MTTQTKPVGQIIIDNAATFSVNQLLVAKDILTKQGAEFDRAELLQIIRDRQRQAATERDARKTAYIHCLNKGHDWHVRSQAAWDAGYDEPVHCWRCGAWDM
jgi:hypothetical protein